MNQKEAYYNAITNVIKEHKIKFEESSTVLTLTKPQADQVIAVICQGFKNGSINLKDTPSNKKKLADQVELEKYARSTLKNWLMKDTRFNGGKPHKIKKPGSRAGQGDKVARNLRTLRDTFEVGSKQYELVNAKFEARKAQVAAEKVKSKREVDYSLIDDELKKQLGL